MLTHGVCSYNTTFFASVGLSNPFLISMITTIVNVVSTLVSFYTIEKFGRRPLLIYGALAMCVCEFVISAVGTADPNSNTANITLIVFVCIYICCFASSWGPAAWVVVGEIFQLQIRAKGVALSTASNWYVAETNLSSATLAHHYTLLHTGSSTASSASSSPTSSTGDTAGWA